MQVGKVDAVIVVPAGYGAALDGQRSAGGRAADPDRGLHRPVAAAARRARSTRPSARVLGVVNLGGRPPLVVPSPQTVQTENLNCDQLLRAEHARACRSCRSASSRRSRSSADREKLILKRLAATPLRRWQLVGSNVLMRLLIAFTQAIIIVAVGVARSSASRSSAACSLVGGVRDPRRDGVPRARLRHRLVRQDRGRGQRDDQR